jgi:hypothetical protein
MSVDGTLQALAGVRAISDIEGKAVFRISIAATVI